MRRGHPDESGTEQLRAAYRHALSGAVVARARFLAVQGEKGILDAEIARRKQA
jgi:hypothetical protein